jgi:hypothetical protein
LGVFYLDVFEFEIVVTDLIHQVAPDREHADSGVRWSQERRRRGRGRRRKIHHRVTGNIFLELDLLFLNLSLSLLDLFLEVFIELLFCLPLGLV